VQAGGAARYDERLPCYGLLLYASRRSAMPQHAASTVASQTASASGADGEMMRDEMPDEREDIC
jgi:hypothetical protein